MTTCDKAGAVINEIYSGLVTIAEVPPEFVEYTKDGYPTLSRDVLDNLHNLWPDMAEHIRKNPKDKQIVLLPDLAEEIPELQLNESGEPYFVFKIREDARFSNGENITIKNFDFDIIHSDEELDYIDLTWIDDSTFEDIIAKKIFSEHQDVRVIDMETASHPRSPGPPRSHGSPRA